MPAPAQGCLLLTILLLFEVVNCTLCYYPDGTLATLDSPCFPDADVSFCCGNGTACLADQLCYNDGYIRGSCTDKTWNSPECPQFCGQGTFISLVEFNRVNI